MQNEQFPPELTEQGGSDYQVPKSFESPRMVPSLDAMARKRLTEEAIKSGDPRALQQFNKGMTNIIPDQNYGSGMSLNEDKRAKISSFFDDKRSTGPASYDQMPPKPSAIGIHDGAQGVPKIVDDTTGFEPMPLNTEHMDGSKKVHLSEREQIPLAGVPDFVKAMPPKEQKSWMDNFNIKNGLASLGQGQLLTNPIADITGAGYEQIISKDIDTQQKIIENPNVSIDKKLDAIKKLQLQKTNLKDAKETASSSRVLMSELHQGNYKKKIAEIEKAIAENPEFAKYLKSDLEKQKTLLKRSENYTSKQQKLLPNDGDSVPSTTLNKADTTLDKAGSVSETINNLEVDTNVGNSDQRNSGSDWKPSGEINKKGKEDIKDPKARNGAMDLLKETFGELFDSKELIKMAVLYLGARATGATGNQALAFAGKNYLANIEKNKSSKLQGEHIQKLIDSGEFSEGTIELYKHTGKGSDLKSKASVAKITRGKDVKQMWHARTGKPMNATSWTRKNGDGSTSSGWGRVDPKTGDFTPFDIGTVTSGSNPLLTLIDPNLSATDKTAIRDQYRMSTQNILGMPEYLKSSDTNDGESIPLNKGGSIFGVSTKDAGLGEADKLLNWAKVNGFSDDPAQITEVYRMAANEAQSWMRGGDGKGRKALPSDFLDNVWIKKQIGNSDLLKLKPETDGKPAVYANYSDVYSLIGNIQDIYGEGNNLGKMSINSFAGIVT